MRPHGSILSQALVAFSAFAVLIAIAAAVGYLGLAHQNSATKQLTGQDYVLQQAVGRMTAAFTISQVSINSYALTGQRGSLAPMTVPGRASPPAWRRSRDMCRRLCAAMPSC